MNSFEPYTTAINKFEFWMQRPAAGDIFVYHEGNLARDRFYSIDVDRKANYIMAMAEKGRIYIYQRRVGDNTWSYEIQRPKGKGPGQW